MMPKGEAASLVRKEQAKAEDAGERSLLSGREEKNEKFCCKGEKWDKAITTSTKCDHAGGRWTNMDCSGDHCCFGTKVQKTDIDKAQCLKKSGVWTKGECTR
eukprot:SRR837773.19874.p3 GENE.SRR837773.19874~~SRR837773.19874.p3  ORF type:complete len:102 (+),score=61.46 SRR837773.19874:108-413(+)